MTRWTRSTSPAASARSTPSSTARGSPAKRAVSRTRPCSPSPLGPNSAAWARRSCCRDPGRRPTSPTRPNIWNAETAQRRPHLRGLADPGHAAALGPGACTHERTARGVPYRSGPAAGPSRNRGEAGGLRSPQPRHGGPVRGATADVAARGRRGQHPPGIPGGVLRPIYVSTTLPGADPATYLRNAVAFVNDRLHGNLGVNLIVHPATEKQLGAALDEAIAELRYGSIGINVWSAFGFLASRAARAPTPATPRRTSSRVPVSCTTPCCSTSRRRT